MALVVKNPLANAGDIRSWVGKISWRRKWQPTSVFLSGESHGQRRLPGYSPWGHQELDMTEATQHNTALECMEKNSEFLLSISCLSGILSFSICINLYNLHNSCMKQSQQPYFIHRETEAYRPSSIYSRGRWQACSRAPIFTTALHLSTAWRGNALACQSALTQMRAIQGLILVHW